MNKKITLAVLLSLVGMSVNAATATKNTTATASISNTCSISASDYNFGVLIPDTSVSSIQNFIVQCTKDVNYKMSVFSQKNPDGFRGFFMTRGNELISPQGNFDKPIGIGIRYVLSTELMLTSTDDYVLAYRSPDNILISLLPGGYDYSMSILLKTGNKLNFPIKMIIDQKYNTRELVPGIYYDVLTIKIDY